jgi:hypothetical protein
VKSQANRSDVKFTNDINIKVDKSMTWGKLKDLPVYSDKGVMVMRKQGTHKHFGNPFTGTGVPGLIQMLDIPSAVQAYKDWLLGKNYTDVKPEQREWILSQIEYLFGKTFLYMKDKGEYYSHADALKDLVPLLYFSSGVAQPTDQYPPYEVQTAREYTPEADRLTQISFVEKTSLTNVGKIQEYSFFDYPDNLTDAQFEKLNFDADEINNYLRPIKTIADIERLYQVGNRRSFDGLVQNKDGEVSLDDFYQELLAVDLLIGNIEYFSLSKLREDYYRDKFEGVDEERAKQVLTKYDQLTDPNQLSLFGELPIFTNEGGENESNCPK